MILIWACLLDKLGKTSRPAKNSNIRKKFIVELFKIIMKFRSSFFFLDGTIIIIVLETFNNENKMYEIKYINSM